VPLVPALDPGGASRTPTPDAGEEARREARRDRTVLVMDDRGPNRSVALILLRELGFAGEAAESGEEALEMLLAGQAAEISLLARRGDLAGCAERLPPLARAWRELAGRLQP
jgi:hypothetical protein